MTMHLVRGMTTIINRKRKRHITKSKLERWEKERRIYNKDMKRLGMHGHQMTMEEYIDYVHGNYRSQTQPHAIQTFRYQSNESQKKHRQYNQCFLKKEFHRPTPKRIMQYTGERRLVGIATMHKSNMVPIFADDDDKSGRKQATEISTMRRN